ncbi:hypothetical protein O3P69_018154 [Scylla paramamosain]|uniref:Uncharacterized protein n=1 Tax=Scylla paramamosain TaxID=85552 RepID=A0AAW0TIJ7_SCYPA
MVSRGEEEGQQLGVSSSMGGGKWEPRVQAGGGLVDIRNHLYCQPSQWLSLQHHRCRIRVLPPAIRMHQLHLVTLNLLHLTPLMTQECLQGLHQQLNQLDPIYNKLLSQS